MSVKVNCKNLKGDIVVPCSKSLAHRYLLASFLAGDIDAVKDFDAYCDDIAATKECLLKLHDDKVIVNCRESGTSFRFLMAVIPALGIKAEIQISDSLAKRPISELVDVLNSHGAEIKKASDTTYKISGKLVAKCIEENEILETLPLEKYKEECDLIDEDVYKAVDIKECVEKRISDGGTSISSVEKQIEYVKKTLG